MGYGVDYSGALLVPKGLWDEAREAIVAAAKRDEEAGDAWWADAAYELSNKPDLLQVLAATQLAGDYCDHTVTDAGEDWIDFSASDARDWGVEPMLNALAPFVRKGEIYCTGEDDAKWRIVIAQGKVTEQGGHTIYGLAETLSGKLQREVDEQLGLT